MVSMFAVVGIFRGYLDLSFYLCAFASLREILTSLVVVCRETLIRPVYENLAVLIG